MWHLVDRLARSVEDATIGTVIVIAHVALADRARARRAPVAPTVDVAGTRVWRSQISP